ncbi:hypothetical protein BASA83_010232 [Batrachochytrium salamandrivorans]|nr:hypothetical protein BASA81_008506 [Batrachochytrium salamandrivorans]KAH9267034.1 hypothetical protein BASA83_010232 [Batrachochytrium salamandrivorans]
MGSGIDPLDKSLIAGAASPSNLKATAMISSLGAAASFGGSLHEEATSTKTGHFEMKGGIGRGSTSVGSNIGSLSSYPSSWRRHESGSSSRNVGSAEMSDSLASPPDRSFDCTRYAQMLEAEGFTPGQTQGLLSLVEEAVNESLLTATKSMVSKQDQKESMGESEKDFQRLRSEISLLEKKDFAVLKGELERLIAETQHIKGFIQDDINRVHGGVRLDVNLEKARIKDEMVELNQLVTKADTKIDEEINTLTARMHELRTQTRVSITQFIVGVLLAFLTYKVVTVFAPFSKKKREPPLFSE